jgi:Fe2+ or Zn2+ uptake regulation protein
MICFNCKATITDKDRAVFNSQTLKAGYKLTKQDLQSVEICANCDQCKTQYQNSVNFEGIE